MSTIPHSNNNNNNVLPFHKFLSQQSFENCINAFLESNYYYYTYPNNNKEDNNNNNNKNNNNIKNKIKKWFQKIKYYFQQSSYTRLCYHGTAALYFSLTIYVYINNINNNNEKNIIINDNNNNENNKIRKLGISLFRRFSLHSVNNNNNNNNNYRLYRSAEGMELITEPRINNNNNKLNNNNSWTSILHFITGISLLPLSFSIRESIPFLSKQQLNNNNNKLNNNNKYKLIHKSMGIAITVMNTLMWRSGFLFGKEKNSSPNYFLILFASPFLLLNVSVIASVLLSKNNNNKLNNNKLNNNKLLSLSCPPLGHVMFGIIFNESIISVMIARSGASLLQTLFQLKINNINNNNINNNINISAEEIEAMEGCYYASIMSTSIIMSVVTGKELYDLIYYLYCHKYQKQFNIHNNNNTKKRNSYQILRDSIRAFKFP